ncbi:MAG TPA: hypothetical protein VD997_08370 [Phycisphaerales bacterium]|nr:hypothetical protein [Phycisphaerales bacterium]
MRASSAFLIVFGSAAVCAAGASAATVNLVTAGSSGTVNGALFETTDVRPAGTGVIRSFLRMQDNDGNEQGYNTSGRPLPFDENNSPQFTRNLQISELATRTVNGTAYYEFLLDTNEPNSAGNPEISLDQLKIFTSATGSQTTTDINSLGTLRYDLDAGENSVVRINDMNSGSGQADVRILIPVAALAGAAPSDFLYLFARFGDTDTAEGGFEEFAALTVIPLPSTAGLGMLGLAGLALRRRRR